MDRKLFATGTALFLAAVLALAVADQLRPWRRLQRQVLELERRELESRLPAARQHADATAGELRAAVDAARAELDERRGEVERLGEELAEYRARLRSAEAHRDRVEAELAALRHRAGDAPGDDAGGPDERTEVRRAALTEAARLARMEVEAVRELVDDRESRWTALHADLEAAEEALDRHYAEVEGLERRLRAVSAGAGFRSLPVVGLLHSSLSVREVAPPGLTRRLPTGDAPRVDRCVTCHLAADGSKAPAGDDRPQPFRRHPRPELFGADSPHPYERLGCTACHGGEGRATDFTRAGHLPASPEVAAAWRERWGWRPGALPGRPISPSPLAEAGCVGCHGDRGWIPGAPAATAGRRLVATACSGCHRAEGDDTPKPGPSLAGIAGKTRPGWVYRWLAAPRDFRPTTWMPHLFDDGGGDGGTGDAERRAVVTYLWERSRPATYPPPPEGDGERGEALFAELGCGACHLLDRDAGREALFPDLDRLHGPNLARTGSKVTAGWLYAWLRDPRGYRHDTPMPDFRLSEEEAADLTAFLVARRDPAWEGLELPPADPAARDRAVLGHLLGETTVEGAHARLEAMSESERELYLGERTVARLGCHGCHDLPGFEAAPPVAGELAARAGHPLRGADLGHLAGTAEARLPELGPYLVAEPDDGGPAIDFGFGRREAAAILTHLLGSGRAPVDRAPPAAEVTRRRSLAEGRRLVDRYGCRGCHRLEGAGGLPAGGPVEPAAAPELDLEGARVRAAWLFDYLGDPEMVTLRPWSSLRMPTFPLGEVERNALVRYFAELRGRPLLTAETPAPSEVELAVGRELFAILQCRRCHPGENEDGGLDASEEPAPAYRLANRRLRPRWAVEWILDPRRFDPDTVMPVTFPPGEDGRPDSTFLIAALTAPMFEEQHRRLLRHFGSEEELLAYVGDPERVAAALRDHLWSLGEER